MQSGLCDTFLTKQTLIDLLSKSKLLHLDGHHIVDIDAKVISDGQGFSSKILRINLQWSDESISLPKCIIIKVITGNTLRELFAERPKEEVEKMIKHIRYAHNVECEVYDLNGLHEMVPMAKCYGNIHSADDKPGIIILEDLADRGIVYPDWSAKLSHGQIESLIQAFANVHVWSVNNTDWRKVIPTLEEFNLTADILELAVSTFPKSKSAYPELFKDLDEAKLNGYVNKKRQLELFGVDPKIRFNLPLVLVHGDVHVMNMMFERKNNDQIGDELIALLDWQLSHHGCGIEDITNLLLFSCPTAIRRENTEHYLRQYVEIFNSQLRNNENSITYEDVKRAYNEIFPFRAIMFIASISFLDTFVNNIHIKDEDQKKIVRDRMFNLYLDIYEDALKILNW